MLVDINLLPQKERDRPAFVIAAVSLLLLGIIIWAVLFFLAQQNTAEQAEVAAESAELASQQELLRSQLESTVGLNEEQQLQQTVLWAESYQYDTVPLLDELVSQLPVRGFFSNFSYIEPNMATLTVQFDETRQAAHYLAQLKASPLIASVTLDSITNELLDTAVDEEDDRVEQSLIENPRYLAVYSMVFVDDRIPAEGTAEGETAETPVEETPAEETPVEETPAEEPVETPVEEESPESGTVPEEEEGDLQ